MTTPTKNETRLDVVHESIHDFFHSRKKGLFQSQDRFNVVADGKVEYWTDIVIESVLPEGTRGLLITNEITRNQVVDNVNDFLTEATSK